MNPTKYTLNVVDGDPDNKVPAYVSPLSASASVRAKALPETFSRRQRTPRVLDQGTLGSCVGHSGRVVYGDTPGNRKLVLSPMWIYKLGKKHDSFPGEDYPGTTVVGACTALVKEGCCLEKFWPYVDSENTLPLDGAAEDAATRPIYAFYKLDMTREVDIKTLLLGESLWLSFNVHEKFFEVGSAGFVDSEGYLTSKRSGGHAVALIGWTVKDGALYWEFQNSWGTHFADKGYFFMEAGLVQQIVHGGAYYLVTNEEEAEHLKQATVPVQPKKVSWITKLLNSVRKLFRF